MTIQERLADWTPARLIEHIAAASAAMAGQAGIGGRETAGAIVSYLAMKPDHIEPFLTGGIMELPSEWIDGGVLTWHSMNGKIVHPGEVREARAARREREECIVLEGRTDEQHGEQFSGDEQGKG